MNYRIFAVAILVAAPLLAMMADGFTGHRAPPAPLPPAALPAPPVAMARPVPMPEPAPQPTEMPAFGEPMPGAGEPMLPLGEPPERSSPATAGGEADGSANPPVQSY